VWRADGRILRVDHPHLPTPIDFSIMVQHRPVEEQL
jgi:hypothetical protein